MALKKVSELEFHLLSTTTPMFSPTMTNPSSQVAAAKQETKKVEGCFRLWEKVWAETFLELEVDRKQIKSDDFLHRELGGLFIGNEPVGFMLYSILNLSRRSNFRSSYFNNYPDELFEALVKNGDETMVISYMTIDENWRKSQTDLPISEILMGLAILRFKESRADKLLGYFRNNRGTQNIFYRHGGTPLLRSQRAYNVDVDFAEITHANAQLSSLPQCAGSTLRLWNQSRELTQRNQVYMTSTTTHPELTENGARNEFTWPFTADERAGINFREDALEREQIL